MIAVDTNILVHAHRAELPLHRRAFAKLRATAEGRDAWALPVFCIGEFVRVVTHPRVLIPPSSLNEALAFIDHLLMSPGARLLVPGNTFPSLFADTCREASARGNLIFDAQIAAVCREHGVTEILTEDRDFARFSSLSTVKLD